MRFLKENKKIVISIASIILLIAFVTLIIKVKNKNKVLPMPQIHSYDIEINSVQTREFQVEQIIQDIFSEAREKYQENRKINARDRIENYYNDTMLEIISSEVKLSFVRLEDIPTTNQCLHNLEGKMVIEVPTTMMDGNQVEISDSGATKSGEYYILRAEDYSSSYTFYYVITFDSLGTIKLNWLCFTENEIDESLIIEK